ncbi:MAG TPA: hypothetical protein QGF58_15930 [Myxococcota bacterium]|nr:hypothetical protein [Myxococcota bacterium]
MAGLALLVACGGPSDTSLHAAVLAADLESVEVADCGTIRHEELRGECQLYAAFTVGSRRGEELGPRCDAVDEGVWRDECYFLAAEDLRRRQRDFAAAGALCARSSRFVDDCGQHLWQSPVKVIVDRHLATGDLESALAEATPVYCEWETILGEDSDIASRFWRKLFGGFFEHTRVLDTERCAPLDDVAEAHCRAAVAQVYLRRLHMLSVAEPDLLCKSTASNKPSVEALRRLPNLQAEPDPLLQSLLEEQHRWACELGEGGLPPMGAELLEVEGTPVDCSG